MRQLASLVMLMCSLATWSAEDKIDSVLAGIGRPAPSTTPFAEVRFSQLLTAPLVTHGEVSYPGPGKLTKRIDSPFQELVEVRGNDVRVERPGSRTRNFSLSRMPELRSLLQALGALLAGDRAALEKVFTLELTEGIAGWTIDLTPRDERVRARIPGIAVLGHDTEPDCFIIEESDGDASFMLFGDLSQQTLPADADRGIVAALCRPAE